MEAASATRDDTAATAAPAARPRADGRLTGLVREAGEIGAFSARSVLALRGASFYFSEALRQAAILVLGTTLIVAFVVAVGGGICGLYGNYALRNIGAQGFTGIFTVGCGLRGVVPLFFGYIFAAKVGCGLVAEIGSMRIAEELDALESTGVDPMRYIVGTRLGGVLLAVPLISIVAIASMSVGGFLVVVVQLGEVSQGAWEVVHWGLQSPADNLSVLIECTVIGVVIVLVSMYYGYRARGGPVGVGAATARSMVLNIVLIHVISSLTQALMYGAGARLPLGG